MRLSSLFCFIILVVKVRSDPNPFIYPKYVLDRIIERAIEAEVNSQYPHGDAKYHNDEDGGFKQKVVQFNNVGTNSYDDNPNSSKKVNQNAQQDQNQRAIPHDIVRKKFLENFFDVEKVPEEILKKSKTLLTKLQVPGSEINYYTGGDYSEDLYSTYKEHPYDSNDKKSEQLKNQDEHYYDSHNKKSEGLKNEDDYPYGSYNKESEQLKNEDAYPYGSYNKESEQLKNEDDNPYYSYNQKSEELKNEDEYPYDSYKKSDEDKEEVENRKPKESFFLQEYSSGYGTEWDGKDSDKTYVPDKKEI